MCILTETVTLSTTTSIEYPYFYDLRKFSSVCDIFWSADGSLEFTVPFRSRQRYI